MWNRLSNKLFKSEVENEKERKLAQHENKLKSFISELHAYQLKVTSLKDLIAIPLTKYESDNEEERKVFSVMQFLFFIIALLFCKRKNV